MGAPDFTKMFNTELSPEQEKEFQTWLSKNNKSADLFDYDLRGAFKDGLLGPDGRGHLTDKYKKPNHPTFSTESTYSNQMMPGGEWIHDGKKWVFKASPLNMNMYGGPSLEQYFKDVEPDSTLLLPQMVQ